MLTKVFFHSSVMLQTQTGAMTNTHTQTEWYLIFLLVGEYNAAEKDQWRYKK